MLYSYHDKRKQSLAEYYYQTYRHLIGNMHVLEYELENNTMREVISIVNSEIISNILPNTGLCYHL